MVMAKIFFHLMQFKISIQNFARIYVRGNRNFINQSLSLSISQLVSYHGDETDITCFR